MSGDGNEMRHLFDADEVRSVLEDTFYKQDNKVEDGPRQARATRARRSTAKPDHYEVICISLYKEDLAALDAKVRAMKAAGHRRVSRSSLIRQALDRFDPSKL